MVERQLPKLNVVGSIPITRSIEPRWLNVHRLVEKVRPESRSALVTDCVLPFAQFVLPHLPEPSTLLEVLKHAVALSGVEQISSERHVRTERVQLR